MSERRLYVNPNDGYQSEVLASAIRASEPGGEDVEIIVLSQPDSERAWADEVAPTKRRCMSPRREPTSSNDTTASRAFGPPTTAKHTTSSPTSTAISTSAEN